MAHTFIHGSQGSRPRDRPVWHGSGSLEGFPFGWTIQWVSAYGTACEQAVAHV